MTRRMKAQADFGPHGVEHDENEHCAATPPCQPIPAKPGVLVPATGTVLVVDGVVQDVKPEDVNVHRCGVGYGAAHHGPGSVTDTIAVRPPKPTFFEAGKIYYRKVSGSIRAQMADVIERVIVKQVEKNGNGGPVAFARVFAGAENADPVVNEWTTLRQFDWGNGGWDEWPS